MKTRNKIDIWRFGLMLALLGMLSMTSLAGATAPVSQIPYGPKDINGNWATPDYYTTANWANSPPLAKFVDTLPGLTAAKANNLGQFLPVAVPDTTTYPGSDYYIIELREYTEKMHSDLNPTTLRGYVQVNAAGQDVAPIHYLGPIILADRDRPVRLLFRNKLPLTANGGNLFIPVDTSVMGAGTGPATANGDPCDNTSLTNANGCASYTQNRADIHLHGGRTPWISDGTPHQWITPAGEITPFKQGVSMQNVPDMPVPGPGESTYYFTNQQSARLMFYHDHAFGITRLNVYAGEAAGYVIKDKHEQDLIDRGIIPPLLDQIPLILQDKTYVDATPVTHPVTGAANTPTVRLTDPLWNWGTGAVDANGIRQPVTGDLWLPHVYMPAQTSIAGAGGVNPFGRWMYGPWFYPATIIQVGPKANPYYDPFCSSSNPFELAECETPGQPEQIPGTPNVSMGMEAFHDSAVVNGTAFPSLTVDPRAYRFRILNAASDRFFNLSFYKADATAGNVSPDPRLDPTNVNYLPGRSNQTEVKTVPASAELAAAGNWPPLWPVDGRVGGVPDPGICTGSGDSLSCPNFGPSFLQIGTEGGFLPKPVVIKQQPITYITDPTAFWVGNVDKMGLALGPAERADVIVDFSQFAGQTLILYNDAPAAWPAGVANYDYFTGTADSRDTGGYGAGGVYNPATGVFDGGHGVLPGYAPNTRTVMQIIVRAAGSTVDGAYTFNKAALEQEFTAAAPIVNTATYQNLSPTKTLFERSQEPIIVGQAAYKDTYPNSYFPTNFPWEGIAQINDQSLQFVTLAGEQVIVPTEPKGLHDEMGASFDPIYGRMSGNLAMQVPNPTTLNALLILYGFSDLPTETIKDSIGVNVEVLAGVAGTPGTVKDGTQIWKISHNGVDTHPIHFHIFDVQLINRVGWDGQILMPEPNELGWKDTVKISPLEDTIIAVRPRAPALPFGIPNSLRPLNPAIPIDSPMGFSSIDPSTGQAYVAPSPYAAGVTNILYNFGWEYVWHCHILSHEEMDMMRPVVLQYEAQLPAAFTATVDANGVNWVDLTPITTVSADPEAYRNPANEIGYNIYRTTGGVFPVDAFGTPTPLNGSTHLQANSTSFADTGASTNGQTYIVEAFNAKGSTLAFVGTPFTVTVSTTNGPTFTSPGPVNLSAAIAGIPSGVVIKQVDFYNGATLIGTSTSTSSPYSLIWNSAPVGANSITAKASINIPGGVIVSASLPITVNGTLAANFTPNDGAIFNVCDVIPFTSTSTGPISGYSWLINGVNYSTNVVNRTLHAGVYPVTLGVTNGTETSQVTKSITVVNTPPVANAGGPYSIGDAGTSLTLNGTGTDADTCDVLSYAWDVDNKNGFEYSIANPTISFKALKAVLGFGVHPMTLKVTDSNGGVSFSTTTITIGVPPTVSITSPVNGALFASGAAIPISADAATALAGSTISKVEFFADGTLIGTATTPPYGINWIGAADGAHTLTAKATDSNGWATTSASVSIGPIATILTTSIPSPQTAGARISLIAAGIGGSGSYEYRFMVSNNGGVTYTELRPYSTATSFTWNTTAVTPGAYTLAVYVRNTGSTAASEAIQTVPYTILAPVTGATLTTSVPSPQTVGASITLNAAGIGGSGAYEYRFMVSSDGGITYTELRPYATAAAFTWNTAAVTPGAYRLAVYVRNAGTTISFEAFKSLPYSISPPASGATMTTSVPSPQIVGTGITLNAAGIGGSGTYEYRFMISNNGGTTYTELRPYSTAASFTWNTTAVTPGAYTLAVYVRNTGSTAASEAIQTVPYTILAPVTGATLTTSVPSPQTVGASITLNAAGIGGSGAYEYRFMVSSDGGITYTELRPYATAAAFTWNTAAVTPGAYRLAVYVRNAGTTISFEAFKSLPYSISPPASGATMTTSVPSPQIVGTGITLNAAGIGGSGTYEYRFMISNNGGTTYTELRPYSTAASFTWNTTAVTPGAYTLAVYVRNTGSTAASEAIQTVPYTILAPVTGATLTTSVPSPQTVGASITLVAAGIGGSGAYEYRFMVSSDGGVTYTELRPYATAAFFTWNTAAVTPGAYRLAVYVRNAGTTISFEAFKSLPYSILAPASGATLTISVPSPQIVGTGITLNAAGIGGSGTYEYRFMVSNNGGVTYTELRPYSTAATFAWNTTAVTPGAYTLAVYVRNTGSTAASEAIQTVPYTILAPVTGATLTASLPSPQTVGASITLVAAGIGGSGVYEYRFMVSNDGGITYTELRPYTTTAAFTWNTAAVTPGAYRLAVYVRNAGTTISFEAFKSLPYSISPPASGATLTTSVPSPQIVGTGITLNAAGIGGSGSYEYRFMISNNGGTTYTELRPYSTAATFAWNTTAVTPGAYTLAVYVRNTGSTAALEAFRSVTYSILAPVTGATLTTNLPSPQKVGANITLNAAGVGGSGTYDYRFMVSSDGGVTYTELRPYATASSFSWNTTAVIPGAYRLAVYVRNTGTTVSFEAFKSLPYSLNP
ncbi:MAG: Ig-like domain-containing protein [Desulfuromonadaceae bacterium]|nr:Ig-like domain-containing protein [Desulfuromonadaceae bacterium]